MKLHIYSELKSEVHEYGVIGLDKQKKISVNLSIFSYPSFLTYILGAEKNHLIETVLLSTHYIYFG